MTAPFLGLNERFLNDLMAHCYSIILNSIIHSLITSSDLKYP